MTRTVDMFLPVSGSVAAGNRLVQRGLRFEVIPNFVADDLLHNAGPGSETPLDAELPNEAFILYVGAFARRKGLSVLLRAYRLLPDPPPLVLIGYDTSEGLKELAQQNLAKAAYAAAQFGRRGKILFPGAPRFNEFVVQTQESPQEINNRLLEKKMIGGFPLSWHYPELGNAQLWCCTELNSKEQIDAAVQAVGQ